MIIIGDVAIPSSEYVKEFKNIFESHFLNHSVLMNFEGLINKITYNKNEPVLFNHPKLIQSLTLNKNLIAGLANNHILDLPHQFDETIRIFKANNIKFVGAGKSKEEAIKPVQIKENNSEIFVYNACWDFLLYNQKNPTNGVHIAEIEEENLLFQVEETRKVNPSSGIVIYLHWNFDLETLPFPMHRQFAKALVDAGANVVTGTHSHCVQGGEKYKNGYIVYGLGNFFIPQNYFANGRIAYPKWASTELVLEWDPTSNSAMCHWFDFNSSNNSIQFINSESFETSIKLKSFSSFQSLSEGEYVNFYKKNRRKKIFIPVFKDFRKKRINRIKIFFLKNRAKLARFLAEKKVIKWQN